MKIGDLVKIPPVRTVIRLADLGDNELRRHLVETFVLTAEASFSLRTILERVAVGSGQGFFVIGNYGSGKSHLLNMLSLAIGEDQARQGLTRSCREGIAAGDNLPGALARAAERSPLPVEISLVEHSNREYLERIVLEAISARLRRSGGIELPADLAALPRREAFTVVRDSIAAAGHGGLLLLIDELSEFLRSKENPRAYNEDVRFLQYLGEFAETIPAWIVATMQENIENTGNLTGELLHKIKDRYPVRLHLTGEHVKEIVSSRLVQKRELAGTALPQVLEELQGAFGRLPFSRQDFIALYPVHPSTVEMLDELRPLFSQHRGVIDFIHHRLAGDAARAIDSFLERPAAELLTPDFIFDHFRDRIRETVETNPYSEQVFRHYEREAARIFEDPGDAGIAMRLLKLLILGALAGAPRHFSAAELTHLLLHRYSGLESAINYDYIEELISRLLAHGAYIAAEERPDGATAYTIDLKADVGLLMEKKLGRFMADLTPGDRRVIENLLPWIDENYLPLGRLQQEPHRKVEISWQNTPRSGKLYFDSPAALQGEALADLEEELATEETDFIFFLVPPYVTGDEGGGRPALPREAGEELQRAFVAWIPRAVSSDEEDLLRRAYAHRLLQEEHAADDSPAGRQICRQLEPLIREEQARVRELFRNLYFQGRLQAGSQSPPPSSFGYAPLEELVARAAAETLKEKYPRHAEIHPLSEQVPGSLLQRTLDLLFSPRLEAESLERGTKMVIDNYLTPLGLVKKKGQGYQLEINPRTSPLTAEFLKRVPESGRVALDKLYRHLRKGPFGLGATGFQVLGTAAILSGAVSAYQGGKRLAPTQVNYYRFWKIEEIGPGTLIRSELRQVLAEVPFLPPRLRSGPLTFAAQQQAWEAVIAFKVEWTGKAAEIRRRISQLTEHPLFASFNWDNLDRMLNRFTAFLEEIKTSFASREGLERFLAAYQASPLAGADWNRLSALEQFFSTDLAEIMRLAHYLKNEALMIPGGPQFEPLNKRYRVLIDLLGEESLLWEENYRERLKREFKQFREDYISLYLAEHNRAVGPGRTGPYRNLLETGAYRLLEQLGRVNTLVVQNDLVEINRQLSRALERECGGADELRLAEHPLCTCGFALGEEVDLPDREELERRIIKGLEAYLEALQAPDQHQKISAHADHLELVGRRREAEPLRELLRLQVHEGKGGLVEKLEALINQAVIAHLNRALTGGAMIAERPLEDLENLVADRVFSIAQLEKLFAEWLSGGGGPPPDYIRVTQRQPPGPAAREKGPQAVREGGQDAREFLEEQAPRLVSLCADMKTETIFAWALIRSWCSYFQPTGQQAAGGEDPGAALFAELAGSRLRSVEDGKPGWSEEFLTLAEALESRGDKLGESFLEQAAQAAGALVSADELIDAFNRLTSAPPHRFESLLELITDEPYFPAVSREAARRIAVQMVAEESGPRLNIMAGMLGEAGKFQAKEKTGLHEAHRSEKRETLQTLKTAAECNLLLVELERLADKPPETDKNWERLYRMISPYELSLARLSEATAKPLLPEVTLKRWERRYASLLEPINEAFAEHSAREPAAGRQTLARLFRQLPGWFAAEKGSHNLFLVILDGVRLDLWQTLLGEFLANQGLGIVREGLLWALSPTNTETQLEPLKTEGLLGHTLNMDDSLVAELVADPSSFLAALDNREPGRGAGGALKAAKYDFIDAKVHGSRDPLPLLLEELQLQARKKLLPFLEYLPTGALLLAAADHGFKTNLYHNRENKDDPLYLHGGNTFFEVLAPWVLVRKG